MSQPPVWPGQPGQPGQPRPDATRQWSPPVYQPSGQPVGYPGPAQPPPGFPPQWGAAPPPPPRRRPKTALIVVAVISVLAIAGATVGVVIATGGSKHTADPTPHPTASLTSAASTSASPSSFPSTSASSSSTPSAQFAAKLCNFLSWHDLHYPGIDGPDRPTKSGPQQGWSQVCLWQSLQFNAGFHLPPSPKCNNSETTSAAGALNCASKDADMLALIFANSHNVNVLIGWQPGHRTVKYRYEYSAGGRKVTVDDKSIESTCIQHLHWADGVLQVEVQDGTKAFGTPCQQAKKYVALLLRREPK